jgi:hypothetical protein
VSQTGLPFRIAHDEKFNQTTHLQYTVTRGKALNGLWGKDNLFHANRYKMNLDMTALNVTNKYALYNFLSTFSDTHYVTPRALTAKITLNF